MWRSSEDLRLITLKNSFKRPDDDKLESSLKLAAFFGLFFFQSLKDFEAFMLWLFKSSLGFSDFFSVIYK